ncbi:PASTA domain-containing protein [Candidatus Latescibacterota bacterium]
MNDSSQFEIHKTSELKTVKKKRSKRIISSILKHVFLAGCAFILAGVIFALTMDNIVMPFYQRTGKEINAPDLRGKPFEDAKMIARGRKLILLADSTEYHNYYPKDTISFQMPAPGTMVKPGRRIMIILSRGAKPLRVPDVVGKTPREADMDIQAAGLYVKEQAWRPSNEYLYGIVARQEPEGGQDVPENTGVILYISNGEKETNIIMPYIINLSLPAAVDTLNTYGFNPSRINIQREEHTDLLPDTVVEQYPDPGLPAHTNDVVDLVVSKSE